MSIFENYKSIISKINHLSNKVTLICVTKTFSLDVIKPLVDNGHVHFGENKVQEARNKWSELLKLNPKLSKSLYNDIMRLSQGTRKLQMKDDKIVKGKDVFHAVLGGSVLIIDDTVGAYRTLIETSIAADNYLKPKYIHSFALLSDWLK